MKGRGLRYFFAFLCMSFFSVIPFSIESIQIGIRNAAAATNLLATGWEAGQERGLSNQVAYSNNVAGYFNSADPPPESGARLNETVHGGSYSLLLAGYSRAAYAYCYYRIFDQDLPIHQGTKIGYWIYHQQGTAKIALDGHFKDGATIRDFGGGVLTDQYGVRIHPGQRIDPMNQWYYVEVDLSAAAGRTLDFILFAFDNGGDGFTGPYRTYVDDLRVFEGTDDAGCIRAVSADHWQGAYFNNLQLGGDPVMVRDDGDGFLDFDWGAGSPDGDCGLGIDRFSVRWTRDIGLNAGTYRFTVTGDDGVRLYVDDALKLDRWIDQAPTTYTVDVTVGSGYHTLELEYYENGGGAVARLSWAAVSTSQGWSYPVGDPVSGAGWQVTNPLGNSWYSSQNQRWYRGHLGEDWARISGGSLGEPVYAAAAGRVVTYLNNCGNYVDVIIIEHQVDGFAEPIYSFYGHLEADGYVTENDWVEKRQQIGVLGDPVSFFPHLHFEIKNRTALVNPPFSSCADTANGIYIGAGYSGLADDYAGGDVYDPSDGLAGNDYYHPSRFIEARKDVNPINDCAEFEADLNYPDGAEVSPDETIRKGWRLSNCGNTTWSASGGYQAVRTAGSYGPASFAVPTVGSGQSGDLYVDITAPAAVGTYRTAYRLEGPRGAFGTEFWVEFSVKAPANPCLKAVAAGRWMGAYFANMDLSGSPAMVRDDGDGFLDFNWGTNSPNSQCGLPADRFSASWTRDIIFSSGTYRFTITGDDGVRLFVDGQLKLAKWLDQAPATYTVDVPLTADVHTIELEYYENGGGAVAKLAWEKLVEPTNDCSVFGADLNYPDGTQVTAGDTIRKGWRLSNCGDTTWSDSNGYRAVRISGVYGPASFPVPAVAPGQNGDLYVDMTVPEAAGTYRATYVLEGPRGIFGTQFWVEVAVQDSPCKAAVPVDHWKGEYFNNRDLSGAAAMIRDDGGGRLDFNWGSGSPAAACGLAADRFSVRWSRSVYFLDGSYRFTITSDDGFKLYIDGVLKLSKWLDQAPTTYNVDVPLSAGNHTVQLEYYENGGGAVASLSWQDITAPSPASALMGLCINANYPEQNPPAWDLAELGVRWVRSIRYRSEITPNHGDVKWLVIFNSETIPRGETESWNDYVLRYAREVAVIVEQNPWIAAVEVWNEQNLPDGDHAPGYGRYLGPADYAFLLQHAYQELKTLPNPPPVVVGGFGADWRAAADYLDEMKSSWNGPVYFDAVGYHPYMATVDGIGWPSQGRMEDNINNLYAHTSGRPLWLTEFGATYQHLGSKELQGQYLEKCYHLFERLKDGQRRKVEVAFWFAWDDRTHWRGSVESYGLVEQDRSGSPATWRRPAWYRYQALAQP